MPSGCDALHAIFHPEFACNVLFLSRNGYFYRTSATSRTGIGDGKICYVNCNTMHWEGIVRDVSISRGQMQKGFKIN